MQRIPIPSKEITQVGYQERSETLEIKFEPGGVYHFFNVPADVFDGLMNAASRFRQRTSGVDAKAISPGYCGWLI